MPRGSFRFPRDLSLPVRVNDIHDNSLDLTLTTMRIANRTFILSGGSSGLGEATAIDLLTSNAHIAILDLNPPQHSTLTSNKDVKFFRVDITKVEEIESAVEAAAAWAQEIGAHLGGVINCAGVGTAAKVSYRSHFPPFPCFLF